MSDLHILFGFMVACVRKWVVVVAGAGIIGFKQVATAAERLPKLGPC